MITSMELDDELFSKAWVLSGKKTKKAALEEILRTYVRLHEQAEVRSLRGRLVWAGDLDEIRGERLADRR